MHQVPTALRDLYDHGDTVRLTEVATVAPLLHDRALTVVRDTGGTTIIIRLSGEIEVPRDAVVFHEGRPAYMDPDYVKCG